MSVDAVRSAYEALGDGDVEPLVALIDPRLELAGPAFAAPVLAVAAFLTWARRGP